MPRSKQRNVTLLPPLLGLDKKTTLQSVPPYTTADVMNCRPMDTDGRRSRIGSRPGIGKVFPEQLGSGNPIRLLNKVSYVGSGVGQWTDYFDGTALDSTVWSTASFNATDGAPLLTGYGLAYAAAEEERSAVRTAYSLDAANPYFVEANINPPRSSESSKNAVYRIYARMATASPDATSSGLVAELILQHTGANRLLNYSGTLKVNGATAATFATGTITDGNKYFTVKIDGDNITCTYDTITLSGPTAIASHSGQTRVGFGVGDGAGLAQSRIARFRIRTQASANERRTIIVASANGQVYYDNNGTMTAVGASNAVATDMPLMAAEFQQKLYIANYSTTASDEFPAIYDPVAGTVAQWTADSGTLPTQCKLICRYRSRLCLAGDINNPHIWYMSRSGDATNWDYTQLSAEDPASAVAATNADASDLGEEITALIPFSDDYLLFGCADSLWSLRGDPGYGGQLDAISRTVGIVSGFAFCQTPLGETVFLSKDGIYMLPPGPLQHPIPVSRARLPGDMLKIDPANIQVTMAYDVEYRGIHIGLTGINSGQTTHYFLDWDNKGFWPVQWPYNYEPYAMHFVGTPTVRGVIMGGRDGYIRIHDDAYTLDDDTASSAYCVYGPVRPGGSAFSEGVVRGLTSTLNPNQNGVAWTVNTAETALGAIDSPTAQITGTFAATTGHGQAFNQVARVRGGAVAIKVADGTAGWPWSVEEIGIVMVPGGRQRRI